MFDWGQKLPRLSGSRLDLRWLTREDAASILSVFGDPEVMKFWSSPPLSDLEAAVALVDRIGRFFESRQLFQWGIYRRETHDLIGTVTLFHLDQAHRRAEVGFALGRSAWGQGFGTEALELLIEFAFDRLDLHRLEADVDPENEPSLRLLERQGFRREGYLRERWHHLGELRDTVLLGLLRREWIRRGMVENQV